MFVILFSIVLLDRLTKRGSQKGEGGRCVVIEGWLTLEQCMPLQYLPAQQP